MMRDLIGKQLGNYQLMKLLGRGGFAEVYLGQHVQINTQQAAIKVLYLTGVDTRKFRQEAEMIASLKHPQIIRLFDFSDQQDMPFLIMDYAPNGSLRAKHATGEKVPLVTIVRYVTQIASALQYAHDMYIIHRDIKPDNVLLGSQRELLLSDFGIAVLSKTGRATVNSPVGTPCYMAPEMFRGKPDQASDQYALAVMVYQWLSGTLPFREGNFLQLGYQHAHEPVPPLRNRAPSVSAEVEAVVMKALVKEPKERFSSVQAFARALEQASQSGQSLVSVSLSEVMPSKHSPPPIIVATPPNPSSQPTTQGPPQHHPSHGSEGSETPPPIPQLTRSPSRRAVIASLVGLTLVSGGIAWLTTSQNLISKLAPRTNPPPLSRGTLLSTYYGASNVVAVAWSPDGKRIASSSWDNTVQVWDAMDGGHVFTYQGHSDTIFSVAWSPDGKRLVSSSKDKTVQVWDAVDGRNAFTYQGHSNYVNAVAWSPGGKRIASGGYDKTVQVWDVVDGGHVFTYQGHSQGVEAVAWSPDGKHIASASDDHTVQVWDAVDGGHAFTYQGHSDVVWAIAWSPDSQRIASSSYDHTVQVWDAVDGGHVFTYQGQADFVPSVAWSPDGKRIASGGSDTKTVQVWDAANGGHVFTYKGHSGVVSSVAWSPDGKRLASGSWDKTVQVWVAS